MRTSTSKHVTQVKADHSALQQKASHRQLASLSLLSSCHHTVANVVVCTIVFYCVVASHVGVAAGNVCQVKLASERIRGYYLADAGNLGFDWSVIRVFSMKVDMNS